MPYQGAPQKVDFKIAVIRVDEAIAGAKGLKEVRVGFIPPPPPPKPPAGPAAKPEAAGAPGPAPATVWAKDAEGIYFLAPHFEEKFYFSQGPFDIMPKANNPNYAKDLAFLQRCAKLMADPDTGLNSKDGAERLLAAFLVQNQFNAYKPQVHGPNPQREPVDAKLSKRIMEIILEADWSKDDPVTQVSAANMFWQLGMGPNDGWKPPQQGFKDQKEVETAGKAWLKANLDKFKLQKYAIAKAAK